MIEIKNWEGLRGMFIVYHSAALPCRQAARDIFGGYIAIFGDKLNDNEIEVVVYPNKQVNLALFQGDRNKPKEEYLTHMNKFDYQSPSAFCNSVTDMVNANL